jgi:AcrR family transcriptional regulator
MSKKDKREEIVQAALEIIAENGFHGAPMVMIAERARVAVGTIYLYFGSKDDLIIETYDCLEGQMLASVMTHYPEIRSIRERFLHVGHHLVNYFLDSPMKFRFVEQFHNSPYGVVRHRDRILNKKSNNIIIELFEEGRRQQIIKDLPLSILEALTFGPLIEICRNHIFQFYELDESIITRTVEACWDAVRR